MGLFSRLFGSKPETRGLLDEAIPAYSTVAFGPSDSGMTVNEQTALTASAVWAAVNMIADAVATLPKHVQSRDTGERQYTHPLHALIHDQPNPDMTSVTAFNALMGNLLLWGNAYAYIQRDEAMRPIAIYPLRSANTHPTRFNNGALMFRTLVGAKMFDLPPEDVIHVLGLSLDGLTGLSPIQYARQTIGLSLAAEKFASRFFSNGGQLGGILKLPPMSKQAVEDFVTNWRASYTGVDAAGKVAVLKDGFSFTPTSVDPEKGQLNDTRTHQVREVARIFQVPLHKLDATANASYASLEVQQQAFYTECIAPWVCKIESELSRKLLTEVEKPRLEIKFNMDAQLRASTRDRYAAHAQGIQSGFLTVNEARAKEGLPPVEGGDVLRVPLNMGPAADSRTLHPTMARALIADAAQRFLTKESKARDKAKDPAQWADDFYPEHRTLVADAMRLPLAAAGSTVTPEQFAEQHCQEQAERARAGEPLELDAAALAQRLTE